MSNEIATNSTIPPEVTDAGLNDLMRQAEAMSAAHKLATVLCNTQMVPQTFRGKPDDGAAAILYGAELGLKPQQALQQIFVVHGQPAIYARTMVALLKGKGYRFETVESTDESVTVRGTSPSGEQETSTWTLDRAKKAGYTSNKKYQTDPQAMLYAKAASEVSRRLAPDVLLGIKYTAEDLELEPVQMNAKRQDVARQALSAPAPKMKKQQKQDEQPDQFVEDVKQAIAELTTAEEVTSFMQEIRNDGDVPEEVIDLGRKRWNELQEEAK
nr:MAG TPA: RecT protein [Caudoviricetes sp.]